jgi:hypothetical protein
MLRAAKCLLLVAVLFVSADLFAANTGPTYSAKLKLGKGGSATGGSLTVQCKGIDFLSLWDLSKTATAKGVLVTSTEELGCFTSNGNVRVTFYSNGANNQITTNGNGFAIAYTVKVSNKGVVTCKSDKSITKGGGDVNVGGISFQASSDPTKSKAKFVFAGSQVDAAFALLPKDAKKGRPTLAGCKDFTLQVGSATFVKQPDDKGNIKF